jgi:multisubunit Na+/H+ antiporter MnhG subunit
MTSALGIGVIAFSLNMVGHSFMLDLATIVTLLFITLLGSVAGAWLANRAAQWIRPTAWGQWITKETAL